MYHAIRKISSICTLPSIVAFAPVAVVPIAAQLITLDSPPFVMMWCVAFSIYFSLKWLSFATCRTRSPSTRRTLGYLFMWPGMNAEAFLNRELRSAKPTDHEWPGAILKIILGLCLTIVVTPQLIDNHRLLAGWTGMIGIIFLLHFGLFHLLSLIWRSAGINAEPIMRSPLLATSLSDFWGRRWNLAFRDLSHQFVFRPLVGRVSTTAATLLVFFASGLIHEWIISVPVQGGWGGPTAYFVLQGLGLIFEKCYFARRFGLGRGLAGRAYCALITIAPVGLLFHKPFVTRVILPTLAAFGIL